MRFHAIPKAHLVSIINLCLYNDPTSPHNFNLTFFIASLLHELQGSSILLVEKEDESIPLFITGKAKLLEEQRSVTHTDRHHRQGPAKRRERYPRIVCVVCLISFLPHSLWLSYFYGAKHPLIKYNIKACIDWFVILNTIDYPTLKKTTSSLLTHL